MQKQIILTSEWFAEHPFAGQNTQHIGQIFKTWFENQTFDNPPYFNNSNIVLVQCLDPNVFTFCFFKYKTSDC